MVNRPWMRRVRSYLELTRLPTFPLGVSVVSMPSLWGMTMAACHMKSLSMVQLCSFASMWYLSNTIRHAAGCVWGDIWDRDVDRLVERSKTRPLASGNVSVSEAFGIFVAFMLAHLWVLSWFDSISFRLSIISLILLDIPYTFFKRWTFWPQAWLGVSLSCGIPIAWISISKDNVNVTTVLSLCVGYICWTIVFDSIYGCQDRPDDVRAGVKSTAVLFGSHIRAILVMFSAGFVACLLLAGVANGQGPCYFIVTVLGAAVHMSWQLWTIDFEDSKQCGRMFKANGNLGYLLWSGMLSDYFWAVYNH